MWSRLAPGTVDTPDTISVYVCMCAGLIDVPPLSARRYAFYYPSALSARARTVPDKGRAPEPRLRKRYHVFGGERTSVLFSSACRMHPWLLANGCWNTHQLGPISAGWYPFSQNNCCYSRRRNTFILHFSNANSRQYCWYVEFDTWPYLLRYKFSRLVIHETISIHPN